MCKAKVVLVARCPLDQLVLTCRLVSAGLWLYHPSETTTYASTALL